MFQLGCSEVIFHNFYPIFTQPGNKSYSALKYKVNASGPLAEAADFSSLKSRGKYLLIFHVLYFRLTGMAVYPCTNPECQQSQVEEVFQHSEVGADVRPVPQPRISRMMVAYSQKV